ncbi:MAG: BamA/TamA family outer membrane protein [Acidobacteriia bacterium]|nr:BamA/TamA family outer membrane protein [Terriglobia bacterium]
MGRLMESRALLSLAIFLAGSPLRGQTPAADSAQAARPQAAAPAVVAVRIVAQDGRVLSAAPADLPIALGQPLDPAAVREALRKLYRTGDYADLQAVRTAVPGGLRLDFVVRENLYFNLVRIEGLTAPPSESTAAAAMQISLGHPYHKDDVDEALGRLRETLQEEGLYEAKASAEAIPHPETQQMDVLVHVTPGPRARIGEIRLLNHTGFPGPELLKRARFAPGRAVTLARLQTGGERLRKYLARKGYLSARAIVRRGEYDPAKKTVPLELEVTEGPHVRVVVSGAKFSSRALKKLVPIYQEGAVDPDLLEEGRRNLRERLEREGYFDAEVSYSAETHEQKKSASGWTAQEKIITYSIERGDRHKLVGIEIDGNRYFSDELLRGRLRLVRAAFASRGHFSRRMLEDDAQSMQALYRDNGFRAARVDGQIVDNYKGAEGNLLIRFAVQEGVQTHVASLTLDGNHAFSTEELVGVLGVIDLTPGQPFSDANVAKDRDNILTLYFREGFPEARFQATAEPEPAASPAAGAADRVRLRYHIEEGPQVRVRRILYTGYQHTRPGVIRREVRLRPEEPLRQGEVVESQRDLYNLGIFNRVTIDPQNPSGSDPDKNVVVLVEETKRYTLGYGGGFEVQRLASTTDPTGGQLRASPRGILEISKVNLTGRADSLSLKLRGSTLQGRALLGYSAPSTFGKKKFSFQATAYAEKTRDISTFSETRYEGSLQLTHTVTPLSTILYRYAFRKVLVNNLRIPSQEVPLFNQPTLVSEFGVTWFRDRRDNPADATRGSFTSVDAGLADTSLGSSASFLRFFAQNSTYHAIRKRFGFARSARLGILRPYRDTVSLSFPAPSTPPLPTVIPLPERFFGGGGTSLRGFALNQAGPRDAITGFPVGGQAELMLNQEFRFPMRVPFFGTQLGGALFYDAGNVFSRLERISLRWAPPKPAFNPLNPMQCQTNCDNELNYFSHIIGFGVRYATPVGPIRVDIGYQLNRATFVIPCPGGPANCQQAAQLPRIQFFFNLGAPF